MISQRGGQSATSNCQGGFKKSGKKTEIFPPCDGEVCLDPPCLVRHQIIYSIQVDDGDECDGDDEDDDDIDDVADDNEIDDMASEVSMWFLTKWLGQLGIVNSDSDAQTE